VKPRWIAGIFVALIVSAAFIALGIWQLARNSEKEKKVREAKAAYAAPAPDLLTIKTPVAAADVQASGTYDHDSAHEILLRDQPQGVDVLTSLRLADGSAVVVDRGTIGLDAAVPPAPSGAVIVRGLVNIANAPSSQAAPERDRGRLSLAAVDMSKITAALPYPVRRVWITARYQQPAPTSAGPRLPQPPPPDPVNHMEYAIEWFAFALIPLVGWPVLMWRRARRAPPEPPESAPADRSTATV
jgi:cytochrome oxidase assembly protein ShyY1